MMKTIAIVLGLTALTAAGNTLPPTPENTLPPTPEIGVLTGLRNPLSHSRRG